MERNIAQIALFAAMIAALGLVPQITLGFGVPITAQTLGVMLAGAVLGARRGAAAAGLFLLLVALGLPLLAGGRGGLGVFVSPTAGFALGFPVAAFATGLFVEHVRLRSAGLAAGLGAVFGGILVLYVLGAAGLAVVSGKGLAEAFGLVAVFIPGDLLKAAITGMLVQALARVRPQTLAWHRADADGAQTRL
ncbi:BioY family transporter [Paracoccus sp. PS-1]|uniref:biotin transporter BioY n=1 Tax=unclassified Paracoccus (in: a-proteobacteria) TaxID=2688777 RepID=UPI00048B3996|nr:MULTISPECIES: BioY family transporter [unclassified Paracoccus (in: a-proteobacteria)]MDQ7260880.1 BioY family transporter [Paracoccus sp. PS1]RQP04304.1 MAG: BioY family transporter [Paracoccus sp. BP8]UFM63924.1 BioY family transporter [Paracoccus sp. MA]